MTAHVTEILPAGNSTGVPILDGIDDETRAVWGFLARYNNRHTRENYRHDIEQFARWCHGDVGLPTMLHATRLHAEMYLRHIQAAGYSQATVQRKFGTVKQFYRYAVIDELIAKDPTVHIDRPPVDHNRQRRTRLTTLQYGQLLNHVRARGPANEYAMITSMGMMGLRIAEMCSLNVESILRQVGQANLRFIGKGNKQFVIDIPLEVLSAFDGIAGDRAEGPLFVTPSSGNRWTPSVARFHFRRVVVAAGLGHVDLTPHGLRRTGAGTLSERGTDLGGIQEWCRHADPRVTKQCYIGEDSGAGRLARQTLATVYSNVAR